MTGGRRSAPALRRVTVEILVAGGWVRGVLAVPSAQSLTDFLNSAGTFLKLADAVLPNGTGPVGFIALHRDAIRFVAPAVEAEPVEPEGGAGITSPWGIACLFDQGVLEGRLDFLVNLRLSDYLRQQAGYLVVRDGSWSGSPEKQHWPVVLVNPGQVLGIVESDHQTGSGHPGRLADTEWA
jgi:hypothetical protein